MTETLQAKLRDANFAGRDALLASQRQFLLSLPQVCHLPAADTPPSEAVADCVSEQFRSQISALAGWRGNAAGGAAIAQYVHFKIAPGANAMDPEFCASLARDANVALGRVGSVDPAFMQGAKEIAGSHGPEAATTGAGEVRVALRLANAFGGFAQRARGVAVAGEALLDSVSLGNLLQSSAENQGGRFSADASQTGDYGVADVFRYRRRTVALLADAWGYDAPAAPGGFAHAGAWDIGTHPATPLCLFETFQMPAAGDAGTSLTAWRDALARVRDSAVPPLGVSFLRDQGQLRAETEWTLLHMPLVVIEQASAPHWTAWLRLRHDAVLDALFAWSQADTAHKPMFEQAFSLLRPASQDLVRYYQQTQALSGAEAKEAAGVAIMELLYGATVTIAPGLAGDLRAPGSAAGRKPRYGVLALPE